MDGVAALRERLLRRESTARDIVEASLAAIEDQVALNAFISVDAAGARASALEADRRLEAGQARPLEGIPITIKDNIAVAGQPLTGGSRALGNRSATADAAAVATLRAAGAIVIGKTGLHELAFGVTSNNGAYGPIRNPQAPDLSPGGSSGGTAVAVAAKMVAAGLGTDTGGSGRIPAAFCGCVGFRPTTSRYPVAGVIQLTWTLDTVSLFARSAKDVAIVDGVLAPRADASAGSCPDLGALTFGVPRDSFAHDLAADVAEAFEAALAALQRSGATLVDVELAEVHRLDQAAGFTLAKFEASLLWRDLLYRRGLEPSRFLDAIASPDVAEVFREILGDGISPGDYARAMNEGLMPLRTLYRRCFDIDGIDALVYPTVPVSPPPLGENHLVMVDGVARPLFPTIGRNASPGALAGLPAISLPCGRTTGGLPFGLEVAGPAGDDVRLLAVAQAVEAAFPR